jgi:vacuolar-type H+-ATPase subunit I/STV1
MIFAGLVFGIYAILRFGMQALVDGAKPKLIYLILLVPLVLFAYVYMSSPLYSPVYLGIIVLLLLATIFFMMYKEDINMMLAEELPIDQLEPEDVVAFEMMDRATVKKLDMKRVLTPEEIGRLRKAGLASVWVYTKLPPFIPFLLIGMILSLFFSNLLFGF